MEALKALLQLFRRPRAVPKPTVKRLVPDESPVEPQTYLEAWRNVLATESGRTIAAHLRFSLWALAGESCQSPRTLEQVALWQMKHEGKFEVLDQLVTEATHNTKLLVEKDTETRLRAIARKMEGEYEQIL